MVRTKADVGSVRSSAAKAPRKFSSGASCSSSPLSKAGSSKDKYCGGNAYNPQPIPNWQKGISNFFKAPNPTESELKKNEPNSSAASSTSSVNLDVGGSSTSDQSNTIDECANSDTGKQFEKNGLISDDEN